MSSPSPLALAVEDVVAGYGGAPVLDGISMQVQPASITAVLGANGAGKTTLLRTITGFVRPRRGRITAGGVSLVRRSPDAIARAGVAHVPEGRGIFAELSVWDNLRMGAYMRRGRPDFKTVLHYFPWLEPRRSQQAGTLSGGEQQMLALARAFLQRPRLLMLDEPSLGLAPLVTREVFRVVTDLNQKEGLAVLVVEQNAAIALTAASRAYVLETGTVKIAGDADDLKANDAVRTAYLGY